MLGLRDIRKRYGSVAALDGVDLDIRPGEIHALLGENGAGKSTLMKVLAGLVRPDSGRILVDERPVEIRRPHDAQRLGIAMVHQHFMLIERMTVAENVLLGEQAGPFWRTPGRMERTVREAAARLALDVDPRAMVATLSVGQRQRVELLKVLRRPVRTLILDEPTAVLTPAETDALFETLRRLRGKGCAVVFITHKLAEVMRLCDRVTVLRHGRTAGSEPIAGCTPAGLAARMMGRARAAGAASIALRDDESRLWGEAVLELRDACTERQEGAAGLQAVSLTVRAGEIFGVAGVDGNGQAALVAAVMNQRRLSRGVVRIGAGRVAHIAADRQREALALPLSVAENAVLKSHGRAPFSKRGVLRWRAIRAHARELIGQFDIRASGVRAAAAELSGGNQQKLVAARELAGEPALIVAVNPARGLDIGAEALVHDRLRAARDRGAAILLVSTDLDEIAALSDRVGVLLGGRLLATRWPDDTVARIGAMMAGAAS